MSDSPHRLRQGGESGMARHLREAVAKVKAMPIKPLLSFTRRISRIFPSLPNSTNADKVFGETGVPDSLCARGTTSSTRARQSLI